MLTPDQMFHQHVLNRERYLEEHAKALARDLHDANARISDLTAELAEAQAEVERLRQEADQRTGLARDLVAAVARAEKAEAERDECRRLLRGLLDALEAEADAERLSDEQDAAFAHLSGIPVIGYEEIRARAERAEAALLEIIAADDKERAIMNRGGCPDVIGWNEVISEARALLAEVAPEEREAK